MIFHARQLDTNIKVEQALRALIESFVSNRKKKRAKTNRRRGKSVGEIGICRKASARSSLAMAAGRDEDLWTSAIASMTSSAVGYTTALASSGIPSFVEEPAGAERFWINLIFPEDLGTQ